MMLKKRLPAFKTPAATELRAMPPRLVQVSLKFHFVSEPV